MFITENTVQTHVRHIFQKPGIRSRTELAAQFLVGPPVPGERAASLLEADPLRAR
jgi:hypothetical protein